jgi:hypothetical protein
MYIYIIYIIVAEISMLPVVWLGDTTRLATELGHWTAKLSLARLQQDAELLERAMERGRERERYTYIYIVITTIYSYVHQLIDIQAAPPCRVNSTWCGAAGSSSPALGVVGGTLCGCLCGGSGSRWKWPKMGESCGDAIRLGRKKIHLVLT